MIDIDFNKVNKLLKAYNEVRQMHYWKKGMYYISPIGSDPDEFDSYNKIIKLLEDNKIEDWFLYFYCLSHACRWSFLWKFKSCYSPKALDMYHVVKSTCIAEIDKTKAKFLRDKKKESEEKKSRWFSLYEHIEDKKRRYINRGSEVICMNNMDQNLGYHPLSEACSECKVKAECAKKIQDYFKFISKTELDILQIRGKITSVEEAEGVIESEGSKFDFYI